MNEQPYTRTQKLFLQTLIDNPTGPQPADWPSPAILRRWLRSPAFKSALESIRQANIVRADLALSQAAASAATLLADLLLVPADQPDYQIPLENFSPILAILRQLHIRTRFVTDPAKSHPAPANSPIPIAGISEARDNERG